MAYQYCVKDRFLYTLIIIQYYILKGKIISTCGLYLQAKESEKISLLCWGFFMWEHKITLQRNAACIVNSQPLNSLKESPHPLLI